MAELATRRITSPRDSVTAPTSNSRSPYYSPSSLADLAMNHNDATSNQPSQSYPSPNAAQMGSGVGPFYSNQPRLDPSDNLQLSAQLSRNAAPLMTGRSDDDHEMLPPNHSENGLLQPTSPEQMAEGGLDMNTDASFGDPTAPRKRSKVSRACDECRRKKIRCDATSESGIEQCSSCKRVGTRCQFSRVPMKRGPSKGYIKELADRLITLENSMQPTQHSDMQYGSMNEDNTSPRASDEFSPPPPSSATSRNPRKRTHSASDSMQSPAYMQTLPQRSGERLPLVGGWSAQDPPRHLPHPVSGLQNPQTPQSGSSISDMNHIPPHYRSNLSPNGVAQPFWRHGAADAGRRESISMPYESSDVRLTDQNHSDTILEWDEKTVEEYYHIIHPTFPLLPHSKARLRSRLANCPMTLREGFLEALYAAVRSFPSSSISPAPDFQSTRKAVDLIAASQFESAATRTMSTNLIYLQTMILMALEADNHGPATMRGQLGPPRAVWLGSAVGLAYFLKLHIIHHREKFSDGDIDSDEKLARRNWWIIVILDRWHASSTSSPLLIPDTSVVLLPGDQVMLGDSFFHLARLSCIIGHLAEIFVAGNDVMAPGSSSGPLIGKLLNGEIERFRESIDSVIGSLNLVYLSYFHVKLLMTRHTPTSEPHDLLGPAQRMASILNSAATPITPLNHHFAALAALTLVELADISETKEGAWKGLANLREAFDNRRGFATQEDSVGWDSAVRDLIVKKQHQAQSGGSGPLLGNHGGLQHLADLAVGERGSGTTSNTNTIGGPGPPPPTNMEKQAAVFDPTRLTRYGYLTVLVQDNDR
ncbi:MAG: Glucose-responsive transcription factor [Pycnora praestabilis]|nr:MAG: Glucose-responsive transcription factor [Pycnora praestabilis]